MHIYVCTHYMYVCIFQLVQNITGYRVYYNGKMINVNSSTTTVTFTAPSPDDGVFTGTVVVMVTTVNSIGVGPASDPATAVINGM